MTRPFIFRPCGGACGSTRGDARAATSSPGKRERGQPPWTRPLDGRGDRRPARTTKETCLCGQTAERGSSHGTPAGISAPRGRPWGGIVKDERRGEGKHGPSPRTRSFDVRDDRHLARTVAGGHISADERREQPRDVCKGQRPARTAVEGRHRGRAAKGGKRGPQRRRKATIGRLRRSAPRTDGCGRTSPRISGVEEGAQSAAADEAAGCPCQSAQRRWP